jgi:hypothetical protein
LRHPRDSRLPGCAVEAGDVDVAGEDLPGIGWVPAEQQVEQCRLARPARPGDAQDLAGLDGQGEPVEHRARPACHGDLSQPQRRPGEVDGCRSSAGCAVLVVEQGQDVLGGRDTFGAVVEAGADGTQRQVHLGREDEHHQCGVQVQPTVDEPQADRHRDDGHRQRGQQLEHERGEERDPQCAHGLLPVGAGHRHEGAPLRLGPPERGEHGQPGDEVEEVVAKHGERAPLAPDTTLGVLADEDHEQRDERDGEADDQRGDPVREQDAAGDHRGHCRGDQQLRHIAGEIAVQPVDAPGGEGGQLGGGAVGLPARSDGQRTVDHRRPQLGQHGRRRVVGGRLRRPGHRGAGEHHGGDQSERDGDGREIRAAEEGVGDHTGQEVGLRHHEAGGDEPQQHAQQHERPDRGGVAQQTRVERFHDRPTGRPWDVGIDVRVTRLRKTQYVHAW